MPKGVLWNADHEFGTLFNFMSKSKFVTFLASKSSKNVNDVVSKRFLKNVLDMRTTDSTNDKSQNAKIPQLTEIQPMALLLGSENAITVPLQCPEAALTAALVSSRDMRSTTRTLTAQNPPFSTNYLVYTVVISV